MARPPKDLVDEIVYSLINTPDQWHFTQYRASHPRAGIELWIGNGRWGLSIQIQEHGLRSVCFGGVVAFALAPWRYRIFSAAVQAQLTAVEKAISRLTISRLKASV